MKKVFVVHFTKTIDYDYSVIAKDEENARRIAEDMLADVGGEEFGALCDAQEGYVEYCYTDEHFSVYNNGTVVQLKDGTYAVIDENDEDSCDDLTQLNYYIAHLKSKDIKDIPAEMRELIKEFNCDHPQYEEIHNSDVVKAVEIKGAKKIWLQN